MTFIVGIVHVKGENESLLQFNPLPGQVLDGTSTGQHQPMVVVQVLKVGIHLWSKH